ncbi:unnamed protein product [Lepidochelys kempii]
MLNWDPRVGCFLAKQGCWGLGVLLEAIGFDQVVLLTPQRQLEFPGKHLLVSNDQSKHYYLFVLWLCPEPLSWTPLRQAPYKATVPAPHSFQDTQHDRCGTQGTNETIREAEDTEKLSGLGLVYLGSRTSTRHGEFNYQIQIGLILMYNKENSQPCMEFSSSI